MSHDSRCTESAWATLGASGTTHFVARQQADRHQCTVLFDFSWIPQCCIRRCNRVDVEPPASFSPHAIILTIRYRRQTTSRDRCRKEIVWIHFFEEREVARSDEVVEEELSCARVPVEARLPDRKCIACARFARGSRTPGNAQCLVFEDEVRQVAIATTFFA